MRELEEPMNRLRQLQHEKDLRIKSLEQLQEIAHWQLMTEFKALREELERYRLVKAGFRIKGN